MTRPHRMPRPSALAALALLSVVAGCGATSEAPADMGQPDLPLSINPDDYGPAVRYRITTLHIPHPTEVAAGAPAGHDVDGTGDVCGMPDYPGNVDNAFMDMAYPAMAGTDPVFMPEEVIDTAINCPTDAEPTSCTRLDLILSVSTGVGRALIHIEDGEGAVLAGPFAGSLAANGDFRGVTARFDLGIPYHWEGGVADFRLDLTNVILTGNVGPSAISNMVLGGFVVRSALEEMFMALLPAFGDVRFEDIAPIVENLYDVELEGDCSALSVGFTGSAEVLPVFAMGLP